MSCLANTQKFPHLSKLDNTSRPVVKCSIIKQIVTDNTVIIHVVLNKPHIPGTLNGCHGLGRSILSVTLYRKMLLWPKNVRKCCFRSTKSLICSVDYSVHPDAVCAIKVVSSLLLIFFSNWVLAFTDTPVEPPPAIAPPPQWAAPSCNGLCEPT